MDPICTYIKKGEKHRQTNSVGLEIEHFVINKETGYPMPYEDIASLFKTIKGEYKTITYENGHAVSLENDTTLITLEPGCQLELSFKYAENLDWILEQYEKAMKSIRKFVEEKGYKIVYSGGLPTIAASQVKRIEKQRYYYMEKYFEKTGYRGYEMMKATAAVHVSIDYADEEDFVKKYRVANILHPVFAFICFNTPYYAGKQNKDIMLRNTIWSHTDQQRCGIVPGLFSDKFGYETYADYIENTPLILMNDNGNFISTGDKKCYEVAKIYGYNTNRIEHYLSMVFPDIRVKQFIEIRSADSMPPKFMKAYAALIQGLFYDEKILNKYLRLTTSVEDIENAKKAIQDKDWDATIYGKSIVDLLQEMISDAKKHSQADCLEPFAKMIQDKKHIFEER